MKIRHPFVLGGIGCAMAWVIRAWIGSLRYRTVKLDPSVIIPGPEQPRPEIYSFWHETLLLPAAVYSHNRSKVVISEHADGEMIARACKHLGFEVVRGSTTRNGARVIRQLMQTKGSNVVFTPDGPRGPRRQVQPGAVYFAAKSGMRIVPTGFAYHRQWRLNSWDRFAMPYPFSPAVGVLGHAIEVPKEVNREMLEHYREKLQRGMDEVTTLAEDLARKERY